MTIPEDNHTPTSGTPQAAPSLMSISMQDGLQVGLLFVLQALSLLLYQWGIISTLIALVAFVGVPIRLYQLGKQYRDGHLGGVASYLQVVSHLSLTYIFGLILGTVAFYFSLAFLARDPHFLEMMETSFAQMEVMLRDMGQDVAQMDILRSLTPKTLTLQISTNAFITGLLYIYFIALFIRRRVAQV